MRRPCVRRVTTARRGPSRPSHAQQALSARARTEWMLTVAASAQQEPTVIGQALRRQRLVPRVTSAQRAPPSRSHAHVEHTTQAAACTTREDAQLALLATIVL